MTLENRGYTKIAPLEPWSPFSFYCDTLIDQLLVFSPDSKDDLTNFALVHDGSLQLQVQRNRYIIRRFKLIFVMFILHWSDINH